MAEEDNSYNIWKSIIYAFKTRFAANPECKTAACRLADSYHVSIIES